MLTLSRVFFTVGGQMVIDKTNMVVLVPALNEQESVGEVLAKLQDNGFHVLLISDGSQDATADTGRKLGEKVLDLPINLGVGGALRAGFKFAILHDFHAVIQVDADGQHPIEEIENLIAATNQHDAHMVIGSRFLMDEMTMNVSRMRRLAMKVLSSSATAATGTKITDSTSGFRLIKEPLLSEFARQFANNYLGDTYESVISAGRANYTVIEIPARLAPREHGESTASTGSAISFTLKGLGVATLGLHKRLRTFDAG
jgi:glycosyltransferase involved in cell wall biosynthesis